MRTLAEYKSLLHGYMQQHAAQYGISRMGIFGSVARGEHREDSDVDVYIEGTLHGFFALSGIKQDLEALLDCKVDVVRLRDRMDSMLRDQIEKEGVYI
jgi:predicted nucleotidyltransferase